MRLPIPVGLHGEFTSELVRPTSIYFHEDGVVRWENQIAPKAVCIEVTGRHLGVIVNRHAYRAIADALAQPELDSGRPANARVTTPGHGGSSPSAAP